MCNHLKCLYVEALQVIPTGQISWLKHYLNTVFSENRLKALENVICDLILKVQKENIKTGFIVSFSIY
jgi:c-di-AMP phosphodiesterase-like protein